MADGDAAIPELSTKALDKLEKALEQPDISVKSLVELADIVQSHGDLYNSLESREKFRQWSEKALQKVLEKEPNNATALSELGESYLSLANHWLDQVEGDGDELSPEEKKAHEAILSSKKYFELAKQELEKVSKLTPKILADLAEIYLNEANLISQEEEQEKLYKNAVDSIKEAKALIEANKSDYTLPEGLTTFLVEYEQQ